MSQIRACSSIRRHNNCVGCVNETGNVSTVIILGTRRSVSDAPQYTIQTNIIYLTYSCEELFYLV